VKLPMHRFKTRRGERGQVLVIAALAMVALLGMVSLSIDVGRMTITRRQLQNAVDASAHAGVQTLPNDTTDATNAANSWATKNGIGGGDTLNVSFSRTNTDNDTITVSASRTVPYTFARVLNLFNSNISATSSATVASVTGGSGIMPFGLVDLDGAGTPGFGYSYGSSVTIKEVPGNHFAPGNYGFLALDGNGGSTMRDTLARGGSTTFYHVGDQVLTEPGQATGPVTQGLDDWAASHHDSMSSSCNDWDASHSYVNGRLAIVGSCRYRVVLIPIIDQWPNGRHDVTILGFAQMYLSGWDASNGKAINAIFLDDTYAHPNIALGAINDYGTKVVRIKN
jgi:Flp pilus assembly protein TadG